MSCTCFITGTGFHAGTTELTIRLAEIAVGKNLNTAVMVPVQTGSCDPMLGKLGEIRRDVSGLLEVPALDACCYSFDGEELPIIAAEQNGIEIDLRRINGAWQNIIDAYSPDVILMENTGGPLTPFSDKLLSGQIPEKLELPVILSVPVSRNAVSETLLALHWFEEHDVETLGIVLSGSNLEESADLIKKYTRIPVISGLNDPEINILLKEVL